MSGVLRFPFPLFLLLLLLLLLRLLVVPVLAQPNGLCPSSASSPCLCDAGWLGRRCSVPAASTLRAGPHRVHWAVDPASSDALLVQFVCETEGWCGLLFGTPTGTMEGGPGDAWIVSVSPVTGARAEDRRVVGEVEPELDAQQDLVDVTGFEAGGRTVVNFRRLLATGDAKDVEIRGDRTVRAAVAHGRADAFQQHDEASRWPHLRLEWFAAPCVRACSGHGLCLRQACLCDAGYVGEDCEWWRRAELTAGPTQEHRVAWHTDDEFVYVQLSCATQGWCGLLWDTEDGEMKDGDLWVVWVTDAGGVYATDRYSASSASTPVSDALQDLEHVRGYEVNGRTVVNFRRRLVTEDHIHDKQIISSGFVGASMAFGRSDATLVFEPHLPVDTFPRLAIQWLPDDVITGGGGGGTAPLACTVACSEHGSCTDSGICLCDDGWLGRSCTTAAQRVCFSADHCMDLLAERASELENGIIRVALRSRASARQWFGLISGASDGMSGGDAWMANVRPDWFPGVTYRGELRDAFSHGFREPDADGVDNLRDVVFLRNATHMIVQFWRDLATGDADDVDLRPGAAFVSWAVGPYTDGQFGQHVTGVDDSTHGVVLLDWSTGRVMSTPTLDGSHVLFGYMGVGALVLFGLVHQTLFPGYSWHRRVLIPLSRGRGKARCVFEPIKTVRLMIRAEAASVVLFIASAALLLVYGYREYEDSGRDGIFAWGHLTAVGLSLVLLPVSKTGFIVRAMHTSFERTVRYHRWIARASIVVTLVHALTQRARIESFSRLWEFQDTREGSGRGWGSLAGLVMLLMAASSIEVVRRRHYWAFYIAHRVLAPLCFAFALLHFHAFIWLLAAPLALYVVDYLYTKIFTSRTAHVEGARVVVSTSSDAARVVVLHGLVDVCEDPWSFEAAQYFYVAVPAISAWQWHPFSVSSAPYALGVDPSAATLLGSGAEARGAGKTGAPPVARFSLHVRDMGPGSFTGKLAELVAGGGAAAVPRLHLHGPYGRVSCHLPKYEQVVLVAGGVGITPLMSLCRQLARTSLLVPRKAKRRVLPRLRRVHLVWVASDDSVFSTWFPGVFADGADLSPSIPGLVVHLYHSRGRPAAVAAEASGQTSTVVEDALAARDSESAPIFAAAAASAEGLAITVDPPPASGPASGPSPPAMPASAELTPAPDPSKRLAQQHMVLSEPTRVRTTVEGNQRAAISLQPSPVARASDQPAAAPVAPATPMPFVPVPMESLLLAGDSPPVPAPRAAADAKAERESDRLFQWSSPESTPPPPPPPPSVTAVVVAHSDEFKAAAASCDGDDSRLPPVHAGKPDALLLLRRWVSGAAAGGEGADIDKTETTSSRVAPTAKVKSETAVIVCGPPRLKLAWQRAALAWHCDFHAETFAL